MTSPGSRKNIAASKVVLAIIIAALPLLITNAYVRNLIILVLIYAIYASSFNLLIGYLGEVSFGHSAFLGLGAYTSALMISRLGLGFWPSLPVSFLVGAAVAAGIGFLAFRVSGIYFAICTLAFAEMLRIITVNWLSLTGGAAGLHVDAVVIPFTAIPMSDLAFIYTGGAMLAATLLLTHRLLQSAIGRAWVSVRDNEPLARSIGVNPAVTKVAAFALAGGIAALSGSLYLAYLRIASPPLLGIYYTSLGLLAVIVGGKGRLFGPVIGVVVFTVLPELLRLQETSVSLLLFSAILLVTILFLPNGLASLVNFLFTHLSWHTGKAK